MIDILKAAQGCQDTNEFLAELKELKGQKARLYRTYVTFEENLFPDVDEKSYDFLTTSKDVYLALGRLSIRGQQNLMTMIVHTLRIEKQTAGLVSLAEENGSLLVSLAESDDTATVHLSPAR
jgi:hypothetical protein